jgi:hypothetical protein
VVFLSPLYLSVILGGQPVYEPLFFFKLAYNGWQVGERLTFSKYYTSKIKIVLISYHFIEVRKGLVLACCNERGRTINPPV